MPALRIRADISRFRFPRENRKRKTYIEKKIDMKITVLGCSAAEGIPAVFCNCTLCKQARERKIFRTRSQILIDDDMLIDFPPDTYYRSLIMGIELGKIENILVTHSHCDHFYAGDFFARGDWSSFCLPVDTVTIHGNTAIRNAFEKNGYARKKGAYVHESRGTINGYNVYDISTEYTVHKPFETFEAGKYVVTALPAKHIPEENCFIYLVREGGKTLLYATDTGYFKRSVFDYFVKNGIRLDAMIVDSTYGLVCSSDKAHMNFFDNDELRKELLSLGVIDEHTQCYLTHIFHGAAKDLDSLDKAVPEGYTLLRDGYTFTI